MMDVIRELHPIQQLGLALVVIGLVGLFVRAIKGGRGE